MVVIKQYGMANGVTSPDSRLRLEGHAQELVTQNAKSLLLIFTCFFFFLILKLNNNILPKNNCEEAQEKGPIGSLPSCE